MHALQLSQLVSKFAGARIMCVGDIMLDRYIYGSVARVSAEAPIPILQESHETIMLGAVGNVARNVAALGGEAAVFSIVGDDAAAATLKRLIAEQQHIYADLILLPGYKTTVKTRYVAKGQQLLRTDREDVVVLEDKFQDQLFEACASEIAHVQAVILSDYAKGCLSPVLIGRLLALAKQHNKPVIVDPKHIDLSVYNGATVLKPNAFELQNAVHLPCGSDGEVEAALAAAKAFLNVEAIVVTRAERGMSAMSGAGEMFHVRDEPTEVVDVSGAGDTASAMFGLALGVKADLRQAVTLANRACHMVVSKAGTACIHADELEKTLQADEFRSAEAKIQPTGSALEKIRRWRTLGLRIGFTNGCFDLIHTGHVSLLSQARARCDRLVVGLNTDDSVKRLKGEGRPINSETARAVVLSSLKDVDLVLFFEEDTPVKLIEAIRPDVLIKGADYTVETVVGSDIVLSYGGEVFLADLAPNESTTRTIEKILG